jgi:hypothetical protein
MAWSDFQEYRPDKELLEDYEESIAPEIFQAIDHNFDEERKFIEDYAESNFTPPQEAPNLISAAAQIGRYARRNADTYQNIFLKNDFLHRLEEENPKYSDVMEYIGLKTLRNGH